MLFYHELWPNVPLDFPIPSSFNCSSIGRLKNEPFGPKTNLSDYLHLCNLQHGTQQHKINPTFKFPTRAQLWRKITSVGKIIILMQHSLSPCKELRVPVLSMFCQMFFLLSPF